MTVSGHNQTANSRPAAVAGFFYPADATELSTLITQFQDQARQEVPAPSPYWPKAIVAPHAGYVYSGQIAARAFRLLEPGRDAIKRVIIAAPAHRMAIHGIALPNVSHFETPLGKIHLDLAAMDLLRPQPETEISDEAHAHEHALEVHLPFLQSLLTSDFTLVPILVGGIEPVKLAHLFEMLWGDRETVFIMSSDLSHYLDYETARRLDQETCHAIEMLRPDLIAPEGACGRIPIKAMILQAQRRDMRATTLDLRNSGDTAGSKDRVVGYGAWSFEDNQAAKLPEAVRKEALLTAARALQMALKADGKAPQVDTNSFSLALRSYRASFITLEVNGQLRGCIGSLMAHCSLAEDIVANSVKAGFQDPRFPPLRSEELKNLTIGISIPGAASPLMFTDEDHLLAQLRPNIDGLILSDAGRRGVFLPQVWENLPDPRQFLRQLKQKAGLPATHWSENLSIERFTVEKFSADAAGLLA